MMLKSHEKLRACARLMTSGLAFFLALNVDLVHAQTADTENPSKAEGIVQIVVPESDPTFEDQISSKADPSAPEITESKQLDSSTADAQASEPLNELPKVESEFETEKSQGQESLTNQKKSLESVFQPSIEVIEKINLEDTEQDDLSDELKPNDANDQNPKEVTDPKDEQVKESEVLSPRSELELLYEKIVVKGTKPGPEKVSPSKKDENIVSRISGRNRFSNSVAISQHGWQQSDHVFLANGYRFADALTGAPLASLHKAPILLVDTQKIEDTTLNEIKRLNAKHITILGGSTSVSDEILRLFTLLDYDTQRIGGIDRYHQAALVAEEIQRAKGKNRDAFLASGEVFSDAMSVSPVAADKILPIYLTRRNHLSTYVMSAIPHVNTWTIIGGHATISKDVECKIAQLGGVVARRFDGRDRYEVNRKINDWFYPKKHLEHVIVVSGELHSDGLPASLLASKLNTSLLLVNNNRRNLRLQTEYLIDHRNIRDRIKFTLIGGTKTIQPSTEKILKDPKGQLIFGREDIILNEARKWVGRGGYGTPDHKFMIDTYNSIRPLPFGYRVLYRDHWCDAFITFLGIQTNMSNLIGRECGVQRHIGIFKRKGIWNEDGRITPKAGDLITFAWSRNRQPNNNSADHIGIVEYVDHVNGTITTIEGNTRQQTGKGPLRVFRKTYQIGDGRIRGYARPRY